VIARGLALWHGRDGNYWGHNAIIRTRAFADCCGLPDLRGPKPFGGHIMSHDFVEAALIRRGGWGVYMVPWLSGSFEESPPSLLDVAARDRRWAQGNLQHIPVMFSAGLAWPSRVHFATGIMSYLASPIWLALLLTGLALSLQARFIRPEYFTNDFSLFPAWPRFDSDGRAAAAQGAGHDRIAHRQPDPKGLRRQSGDCLVTDCGDAAVCARCTGDDAAAEPARDRDPVGARFRLESATT
jgi:membrane glycosyltransferase